MIDAENAEWVTIPVAIGEEKDRRDLAAIMTSIGLEVRILRVRHNNKGTPKRYIQYRYTGLDIPTITSSDGKTSE